MSFDPTNIIWNKTGCTAAASGILTENTANDRHAVWQDIQPLVTAGLGTSAIMKAKITPIGRTRAWIGCRQNNGNFMASFLLSGAGTVESQGSSVTSATIQNNGDGSYTCRVTFSGTFSTTSTVFSVGALIAAGSQTYTGTSIDAIQVTEAQLIKGTTDRTYEPTTNRNTYADQATVDGSQNAAVPGSNVPDLLNTDYGSTAGNAGLTISDFTYNLTTFTFAALLDWSGNESTFKVLGGHWDGDAQNSWLAYLDTTGHFTVAISNDGSNIDKLYTAVTPLDTNEKTLCVFTWDGTTLRLYYNNVELTVASGELTKTIDGAVSGALHNSTAPIVTFDAHHGKFYEDRLYAEALTPAAVSTLAGSFGVSGLPDGSGPGGGTGNLPATRAELITYLTGKGVSSIFYVNNATGNDSNVGSLASPWLTIQKAANTLTAGQAVIIQGAAGRFYESVTPSSSGTAGNLIWYCGDPENPAIIDGSEDFTPSGGSNWTSEGGGMFSAAYTRTRPFNEEQAYFTNCTIPANCRSRSVFMSHQLIYNDAQLVRISNDDHTANPALNAGECFFECAGNTDENYKTPTRVWCRLPGDIDPDTVEMRVGSNKLTLFDYSPNVWSVDGTLWPGGPNPTDRRAGRSYIGLVNLHFKYSGLGRKIGPVILRGTGWFVEWCSFSDANTEAMSFSGDNHTIINCKFRNFGKGLKGDAWQQDAAGQSIFQKCLFEGGNIHRFPEAWDAGFKLTDGCGNGGTIIWEDCLFKDIQAPGFWTDISNGNLNGSEEAFRFLRCIFERCGRHALFMENNSYYMNVQHCGIWDTQYSLDGQAGQELASAFRIAGSGRNTVNNCAIVYNQGKGWYMKPDDTRASAHGANQDTVTNNVFVENARDTRIELQRVDIHGGNYQGGSAENWNTSDFNGNVFFNSLPSGVSYFFDSNNPPADNDLAAFEARTTSSGNAIAASAGVVVEDHTDRKAFWKTAAGTYPTKGPQNLVHYEDLPETGWTIPA